MVPLLGFAQKNVVKGRAVGLPIDGFKFSINLGYERLLTNKLSVQLLYDFRGHNMTKYDGSNTKYHGIIPECRYYILKNDNTRFKGYFGLFTEILIGKSSPPYSTESEKGFYVGAEITQINPGLQAGTNIPLGKKWHLDIYAGYKIENRKGNSLYNDNGIITPYPFSVQYRKFRYGINLGFEF